MRSIVNLVIVMALATQVSHAAWLFNDIGKPDDGTLPWMGWVFALSLETSIFVFTIYSRNRVATFFAVVSTLVNLLYYWIEVSLSHRFFAMLVISPIIPTTIYYYSDLIAMLRAKEEEDAQPIGGWTVPSAAPSQSIPESPIQGPATGIPAVQTPSKAWVGEIDPPVQKVRNEPEAQDRPKPVAKGNVNKPRKVVPKESKDDWVIVEDDVQQGIPAGAPVSTDWRDRSPNTEV